MEAWNYPPYTEVRKEMTGGTKMLVPMGDACQLSIPVPRLTDGKLYECFFLSDLHTVSADRATLERPFAWGTVDSQTKSVVSYSACHLRDFVDTRRFPLHGLVSNLVSVTVTREERKGAFMQLYDNYEEVRKGFALQSKAPYVMPLSGARRAYASQFFKVARIGHYPFLYALSPAFFDWMDMTEPMAAQCGDITLFRPESTGAEPPAGALADKLDALRELFETAIAADAYKTSQLDSLHRELQDYRNGLQDKPLLSVAMDLILLIDTLAKTRSRLEQRFEPSEAFQAALRCIDDIAGELSDTLYRAEIEEYRCDRQAVDPKRQKIVGYVPTDDPQMANLPAQSIGAGYRYRERTLRAEPISIYRYERKD